MPKGPQDQRRPADVIGAVRQGQANRHRRGDRGDHGGVHERRRRRSAAWLMLLSQVPGLPGRAMMGHLMTGVGSMVYFIRRAAFGRRSAPDDVVPKELVRALDASAEDLKHGRVAGLDDMLKEMQAELDAHRAGKMKAPC